MTAKKPKYPRIKCNVILTPRGERTLQRVASQLDMVEAMQAHADKLQQERKQS